MKWQFNDVRFAVTSSASFHTGWSLDDRLYSPLRFPTSLCAEGHGSVSSFFAAVICADGSEIPLLPQVPESTCT